MKRLIRPSFFVKGTEVPEASGDDDEEEEGTGSTPVGDTTASGSGEVGSSSNVPGSQASSQAHETPSSSSRNIENVPSVPRGPGSTSSTSKPSESKYKLPSLTVDTGKSSIHRDTTAGPSNTQAPPPPPRATATGSLRSGLQEISQTYPGSTGSPASWNDGGLIQGGGKKVKGQVRFGSVDVREFSGPGGPYGSTKERRGQPRGNIDFERDSPPILSPTSSLSPPPPSSLARRKPPPERIRDERSASPSPSSLARRPSPMRRRSGGRVPSSLSPNRRGRQRQEEDASSMGPMSPPPSRDKEKNRFAEKFSAFSRWKTKREMENAPSSSEPTRPITQNEARNQTAWRTPREAKAARERELAAKDEQMALEVAAEEERRRQRELSRDRAVEVAIRHEEEERLRERATGVEAGTTASASQQTRRRSADSGSISPRSKIPERASGGSNREDPAGRSGTTQERSRRQSQEQTGGSEQSQGQPRENSRGGPGGDPGGDPDGQGETSQDPNEPGEKPTDSKDDPPKKPTIGQRIAAKHRVRVLKPKNGKLTKVPDPYRQAKTRELEAMSTPEKRLRKLLQIKRRLNQYGMLATVVTSVYLICFGVAWQEHHRWNNHDKEERPINTSPFAMWCVCMVWISMATALNMLAIRTIFKLWMFGRKYKTWAYGEWKWQLFSKAGLMICMLIGGVTIASFGGTVTMLREARTLEIERGYFVP
ncbi:hypothetical protein TWF506_011377 [Arthrobotrys conoides]|uniref:Uncharacterized protein n=1 Tax=Arthrobotrys conoides TaxID=74498 RepID=A0AAN8N133_9PEZI